LKNQKNEKEESCHKMEEEFFDLRRKSEKSNAHFKLMNNSIILDEILDSERSLNDKSRVGYKKEYAHYEVGTSNKHDVGPLFSKGESKDAIQAPEQRKKICIRSEEGDTKKPTLHLKENSKERYLQG
jgi:hypothetical protein